MRWTLLVDESGDFSRDWQPVCVAGALVPQDQLRPLDTELSFAVNQADSLAPWPLHAAHLNLVSWLAMAWTRQASSGGTGGGRLLSACHEATDRLERRFGRDLDRAFQLVVTGRKPDWDMLVRFDRHVQRSCSRSYRTLRDHQVTLFRAVARGVQAFRRGEAGHQLGSLALLVAGESDQGNGMRSSLSADRYLALLQVLVERAADVLAYHSAEPQQLTVVPFERDVRLGRGSQRLTAAHLVPLLERSVHPEQVQLVAGRPGPYPGPHPAAGFLADLLANRSRRALDGSLRTAHDSITPDFGLAPRSGQPARSHLAAHEIARNYILARRAGDQPDRSMLSPLAPWASAQALQWGVP